MLVAFLGACIGLMLASCRRVDTLNEIAPDAQGFQGPTGIYPIYADTSGLAPMEGLYLASDQVSLDGYGPSLFSAGSKHTDNAQIGEARFKMRFGSSYGILRLIITSISSNLKKKPLFVRWSFDTVGSQLILDSIDLATYHQHSYDDPTRYENSENLIYELNDTLYLYPQTVQPQWTLPNGSTYYKVLVGPKIASMVQLQGPALLQASNIIFAQNIGWIDAQVTYTSADGSSYTKRFTRIVPKD